VSVAPISTIPATLRSLGIDPATVMRSVGLDPQLFENPSNRASIVPIGRLLEACVATSGKPHFGLIIGRQFSMPMLGLVGYLMSNEMSVRDALKTLVLSLRLQDRSAVAGVTQPSDHLVALTYAVFAPGTPATGLIDDTCIMIGWRILKSLCGPEWRPAEVRLAHARPLDSRVYREMFDAPVRFDVPLSMLLFDKRWLDAPVRGADPVLLGLMQQLQTEIESKSATRLTDQVRRALRTGVMSGHSDARGIAELFSVSERSLRRRLADEGSSLQALVAEVRLTIARQLLEETRMPISEIAAALDYADLTAFSRAFRGWTGKPPGEWRRAH
jgi:AraC-like DNA-binding protein